MKNGPYEGGEKSCCLKCTSRASSKLMQRESSSFTVLSTPDPFLGVCFGLISSRTHDCLLQMHVRCTADHSTTDNTSGQEICPHEKSGKQKTKFTFLQETNSATDTRVAILRCYFFTSTYCIFNRSVSSGSTI